MRNCCSRDLVDPAAHVRDFEPIWLDDYLDYLIVPNKELAPTLTLTLTLTLTTLTLTLTPTRSSRPTSACRTSPPRSCSRW